MEDTIEAVLPVYYSNTSDPNIHLYQFPLLERPLHIPPAAAASGKIITARHKQSIARTEIHVPLDTRQEVWNPERGRELGQARHGSDKANAPPDRNARDDPNPRLTEVRLRSELVPSKGDYMLGILHGNAIHLHPLQQVHQLRPSLEYLDFISQKNARRNRADSDSDSDDGPPPDPDDLVPEVETPKARKPAGEAKEVQVSARKGDDKGGDQRSIGLSSVRREILSQIRLEEEENWEPLEYHDEEAADSIQIFEELTRASDRVLISKGSIRDVMQDISENSDLPPSK
ncbi:hypothetical protein SISNIDRAFT_549959 [Sistotremastrum niveocremeum HHB9708]|uniref:DNA-directed RNA polymerase III subunit Rpc5 n=1 Tax=Sistotremastrum niveocremeum HHB9708 TaxID=1314777 RepID=A0A164U524_9AGAM|nr:hypothetical protein SISNIDRAFT_549959 [Sistotremastrum niveocremeum HHB9708]